MAETVAQHRGVGNRRAQGVLGLLYFQLPQETLIGGVEVHLGRPLLAEDQTVRVVTQQDSFRDVHSEQGTRILVIGPSLLNFQYTLR